jgi:glycosyltransferase involved in cell wall biosynthesis
MRVLQLAPPARMQGGITAHTFIDEEIRALRDAGVECLSVSDALAAPDNRAGVDVVPVDRPTVSSVAGTLAFAARHLGALPVPAMSSVRELFHALRIEQTAASAVRSHGVDVIHSHFGWPAGFGGLLAAADTGVPLVASLRGMDLVVRPDLQYGLRQDRLYDRAVRQLVKRADRTVYASEFMRAAGIGAGAPAERTFVVRKGVDLNRFRPAANREAAQQALGWRGPIILAIGTLRPLKGYSVLLRALAPLANQRWTLVICGEGPLRATLERETVELGLGDRVVFAGTVPRDRVPEYFAAADIFAHPSLSEAAGNVILEALASGCALVATDSGGPAEHIVHGETGIVVPAADAPSFAEALRQVLDNPSLRERLGRAARADADRRFDYARMIRDLIEVYAGTFDRAPTNSTSDSGMRSVARRAS